MIQRVAIAIWECEHPLGQNVLVADVKFPNQDPQWDNGTPGHQENMRDQLSSCLKDQMRKYAGLDLEDPLGQGMLKFHFVTNSWTENYKN
jgi:hypothetical protein